MLLIGGTTLPTLCADWVAANHKKPAVVTLSLGIQVGAARARPAAACCLTRVLLAIAVQKLPTACASHAHPLPCHLHDLIWLSLGASHWFALLPQVGSWSRVLEDAVRSLINDHGVTVVVASGNSGVDACYVAPGEACAQLVSPNDLSCKRRGAVGKSP